MVSLLNNWTLILELADPEGPYTGVLAGCLAQSQARDSFRAAVTKFCKRRVGSERLLRAIKILRPLHDTCRRVALQERHIGFLCWDKHLLLDHALYAG